MRACNAGARLPRPARRARRYTGRVGLPAHQRIGLGIDAQSAKSSGGQRWRSAHASHPAKPNGRPDHPLSPMGPSPPTPHPLLPFAFLPGELGPTGQPRTLPRCLLFCDPYLQQLVCALAGLGGRSATDHGNAGMSVGSARPIGRSCVSTTLALPVAHGWTCRTTSLSLSLFLSLTGPLLSLTRCPLSCADGASPYCQMWCGLRSGLDGQRVSRSR